MNIKTTCKLIVSFIFGVLLNQTHASQTSQEDSDKTIVTVFFVQHAEMDLERTGIPLTPDGTVRASQLVRTFSQVPQSHVYASHTHRARQTVSSVAEEKGLVVNEFPQLGSTIDEKVIWDASPSSLPLCRSLNQLINYH